MKRKTPAKPKKNPRSPWLGAILAGIAGLFLGGLLGLATGVILSTDSGTTPPMAWNGFRDPINILVMGTDVSNSNKNPGLTGNTDTMLLVNLNPQTKKVKILSVPRDTRVPIPEHRTFKINAANPFGGPELSVKTVSQFLTVPVHRYVLINTRALIEAVDAIGGVTVTIPKRVRYHDFHGGLHIDFQKGTQHLSGKQVQEYLRFRHDELGDIGRVQRQQGFLMELTDQFLRPAVLLKAPSLLQIIQHNSKTNLSALEIVQLVNFGKQLKGSEDVQLVMVPGRPQTIEGLSYWLADLAPIEEYLNEHFRIGIATSPTATPRSSTVSIYDGSGRRPSIKEARRLLEAQGFIIRNVKRVESQPSTKIIIQRGDEKRADEIQSTLGLGEKVEASIGDIYSDFTVILGEDWSPKQTTPTP